MSYTCLSNFYVSSEWQKFRKVLIMERMDNNGNIIDEVTNKPIINKYDIILHHKIPLNEQNIFDYDIAFNPDNIQIVSHATHNEIHKRFGSYQRHIYIIYGSPCSGKSYYVDSVAMKDDLIIDIDKIFIAINNYRSNRLLGNVMNIYRQLIDVVKTRNGQWVNAYIIRGFPIPLERERLAKELDAELIFIDTDKETCLQRAKKKGNEYYKFVLDWFEKYTE